MTVPVTDYQQLPPRRCACLLRVTRSSSRRPTRITPSRSRSGAPYWRRTYRSANAYPQSSVDGRRQRLSKRWKSTLRSRRMRRQFKTKSGRQRRLRRQQGTAAELGRPGPFRCFYKKPPDPGRRGLRARSVSESASAFKFKLCSLDF